MTTTPQHRQFELFELPIAALAWSGEGLPLIALHGWLDNAASFLPLAPWLTDHHLLAPDLIGHGHSAHLPPAAGYHLADYCRWVVALADTMGWERFGLIGHSMGAAVASITAAAIPRRISALVLIDGLGPLAFTPEQGIARLQQCFDDTSSTRPKRYFPDLASAVAVRQRLGRFPIGTAAAQLLTERGMRREDDGYCWRHDERLRGPNTHYYSPEQSAAVLRTIRAPTLFIQASTGALQGWSALESRLACIHALEQHTLPGGHHLHMEAPQSVARLINSFLARQSA